MKRKLFIKAQQVERDRLVITRKRFFEFIEDILDEFEDGWMFSAKKIKQTIKQKAGELE